MKKIEKETMKMMDEVSKQLFDFGVREVDLFLNKKDYIKLRTEISIPKYELGIPILISRTSDNGIMFRIKSL